MSMDEARFWQVVEQSRRAGRGDMERQGEALATALAAMPLDDVVGFQAEFDRLHASLHTWELWGAAYTVLGGCSDDGFIDFRTWVLSQGRDAYRRATTDPDALAEIIRSLEPLEEAETFAYVAADVYEARADGAELPRSAPAGHDAPSGEPWDEGTVDERYPRLTRLAERLDGGEEPEGWFARLLRRFRRD